MICICMLTMTICTPWIIVLYDFLDVDMIPRSCVQQAHAKFAIP